MYWALYVPGETVKLDIVIPDGRSGEETTDRTQRGPRPGPSDWQCGVSTWAPCPSKAYAELFPCLSHSFLRISTPSSWEETLESLCPAADLEADLRRPPCPKGDCLK